ncbi:putative protein (CYTH domain) [Campylobacter pinnipediorum subsp. caledonicus]|uniref:Uncharacterized protein n=1 Tax=Campylobacter pinnipediorum subsp. caledonicus TaxID=1874362 RepID=A0A1S6U9C6_9BACT|nr:hypothetical protein [Campylobacter pinnipediorum]AQW88300.1 putative protein (CYTH domain) [Campylobacter pinnipediorum subsp. caledonicus]OPA70561.1 hypothetical protein BB381_04185 [Campylobacter pinnipediorum subsp. caledonicus]
MELFIQRRFLLKDNKLLEFLTSLGVFFNAYNTTQFYTKITPQEEIIYKNNDNAFIKIRKITSNNSVKTDSQKISEDEFNDALKYKLGSVIYKKRYAFMINNNNSYIDEYMGDLSDLCMLDIEFKNELYGIFFKIKEPFGDFVLQDVSDKNEFSDKNLSLFGYLKKDFDSDSKSSHSKNALKYIFLKNIDRQSYGFEDEMMLLSIFDKVFDFELTNAFKDNFKKINQIYKIKLELLSCVNVMQDIKDCGDLKDFINDALVIENENIKNELDKIKSKDILSDWELFLQEDSSFYDGDFADKKIINLVSYALRLESLRVLKSLRNIDLKTTNDFLYNIQSNIKNLSCLIFYFSNFYDISVFKKMKKRVAIINLLLEKLYSYDLFLKVLDSSFLSQKKKDKISTKIYEKIYKVRKNIVKKSAKAVKTLHIFSKNIKIYY